MQTYEILVQNRAVKANSVDTTLVRTSVGIDRIHVLFDSDEWLDFPVTVTFAQSSDLYTQTLVVNRLNDSQWVAESYATIPWEVIDENGPIRITLQGTDSQGRHIITAKGAPLTVEEAGDVTLGDIPESAPTVDQWQRAYADAMAAANQAASLVATLQEQLSSMVDAAQGSVDSSASDALAEIQELLDGIGYATEDRAGIVQIGDGIDVLNGVISTASSGGLNARQRRALENLVRLALVTFNSNVEATTFNQNVTLAEGVLPKATPVRLGGVKIDGLTIKSYDDGTIYGTVGKVATMDEAGSVKPDGTSIVADQDGTIHGYTPDGTTITAGSDRVLHGANTTPVATLSTAGKVKPDGTSITIDSDGTIHGRGSADWNASSGEDGYIRNRPFYTTVTQVVDRTLPYVARRGNAGWYTQGQANATNPMVVGKTYFVTISSGWYAGAYEIECTSSAGNPTLRTKVGAYWLEIVQLNSNVTNTLSFDFQTADSFIGTSEFFYDEKRVRIWSEDVTKLPAKYLPIDGTSITADDDGIVHSMPSVDNDTLLYAGGVLKANVMGDITDITPFGELIPDGDEVGY